jgi:23S rRNA (cytidine1920-2'-O)/16S rRNA (cytidine1409-2'-O)-methyltransferase
VVDFAYSIGFDVLDLEFSPIKGPEGNIEYLLFIQKNESRCAETLEITEKEAEEALSVIIEQKSGYSTDAVWAKKIDDITQESHKLLNS